MCTIRPAVLDDIPQLVRLLALLFAQEEEFAPDAACQEEGLRRIIADPAVGKILVMFEDTAAVGMVNLLYTVSTALGARVAILEDMIILEQQRGRGLGSELLQAAIDMCRADGARRITLLTDASNFAAQRFYQRCGFRPSSMLALRHALPK